MELHESQEMYLETILRLSQNHEKVRAIDVSRELNFSRPSVSIAIKSLKEKGFLEVLSDQSIILTSKGKDIANNVYSKHLSLTKLLESFGVSQKTAEDDACRIEHIISDETFDCIKAYLAKEEK